MSVVFPEDVFACNNEKAALITDEGICSYAELQRHIAEWQEKLSSTVERPLVALAMCGNVDSVSCYLACLKSGFPVVLFHPGLSAAGQQALITRLTPNLLVADNSLTVKHQRCIPVAGELALLLTTSGSTGGGKFVALSRENLAANTASICSYLPVTSEDKTLLTMPLSYSYGLSVLNTHLAKGATVRLTSLTPMDRAFWTLLKDEAVTSLSGVPSFYEMLLRLRFDRQLLPELAYFTQAGGKLKEAGVKTLAEYADKYNKQCFIMYGQTEATARMAYLDPHTVLSKPSAAGKAIPGGKLSLCDEHGRLISEPGVTGELLYEGKNVMLGYVSDHTDLAVFTPPPVLHTGDLAFFDEDGDYTITGRLKRIIKLAGERVNLDGLEALFAEQGLEVKVAGEDNFLVTACRESKMSEAESRLKSLVSAPPAYLTVRAFSDWPLLGNGKTDYQAILKAGRDKHDNG